MLTTGFLTSCEIAQRNLGHFNSSTALFICGIVIKRMFFNSEQVFDKLLQNCLETSPCFYLLLDPSEPKGFFYPVTRVVAMWRFIDVIRPINSSGEFFSPNINAGVR
jgi:hypothetical protein